MFAGQDLLSEGHIARHLNIFEALVTNYSPNYGPMRAGLCDVKSGICSQFTYPDAGDDKTAWAVSYLKHLQNHAGLGRFKIRYLPVAQDTAGSEMVKPGNAQDEFWADILSVSDVYFDPERCLEPGYLSSLAARSFAQSLLSLNSGLPEIKDGDKDEHLRAAAGFLGLGLAGIKPADSIADQQAGAGSADYAAHASDAIFISALFLAVKGYTAERLTQIYGGRIDAPVMEQMQQSFDRLKAYKSRIDHMRDLIISAQNETSSAKILTAQRRA